MLHLQIPSLYYTPSPEGSLLPTGQILSAKNTIYDFTQPKPIRKDYAKANGGPYKGFNVNYVMSRPRRKSGACVVETRNEPTGKHNWL